MSRLHYNCAVVIDVENIPARALHRLIHWLRARFNIVAAMGFADFAQPTLLNAKAALQRLGITLCNVPTQHASRSYRKNMVDHTLVAETMWFHAHRGKEIDVYVLVSGDGHLAPMARIFHRDHKRVIVAAMPQSSNAWLRQEADQFIPLRSLAKACPRPLH